MEKNHIQNEIGKVISSWKHKCTHTKIGYQKQNSRNHVNENEEQLRKEILN